MKKSLLITTIIITPILILFLVRAFSPREIDDITPGIPCEQEYIEKSQILWVIPLFNNSSIAENPEWCEQILQLNKTLGLHGIYHTYKELDTNKNQEYLQKGISAFEDCFGYTPKIFKPSHLAISQNNKNLIENNNLKVYGIINQFTHKVYHCSDTGVFSNTFIDFF